MDDNGNRIETLGRAECLALMATVPIGRVVFTDLALPAIQPVNFVLDANGDVIIRTAPGSKLDAALRGAVVAFETDDIAPGAPAGWSVTAIGRARHVTIPAEVDHLQSLPLTTWAPGPHDHFIRIIPRDISGFRLITPVHARNPASIREAPSPQQEAHEPTMGPNSPGTGNSDRRASAPSAALTSGTDSQGAVTYGSSKAGRH